MPVRTQSLGRRARRAALPRLIRLGETCNAALIHEFPEAPAHLKVQTEKLDPQPQVVVAFGFLITNWAP
jgi:hypothetical protein